MDMWLGMGEQIREDLVGVLSGGGSPGRCRHVNCVDSDWLRNHVGPEMSSGQPWQAINELRVAGE